MRLAVCAKVEQMKNPSNLTTNIKLGLKCPTATNALAYYLKM